jgi:hypothetical protein
VERGYPQRAPFGARWPTDLENAREFSRAASPAFSASSLNARVANYAAEICRGSMACMRELIPRRAVERARRKDMERVYFSIVQMNGSGWAIRHDGKLQGGYATKDAAFEAAIAPASEAVKEGHAVTISVEGREALQPVL